VPLALGAACALLVTVRAIQDGRDRWWLAAGIAAGVAASTKWNGLAVLGVPLLACLLASDRPADFLAFARRRTPWLIGTAALATVLAITPGLLLEARTAARNLLQLGRHYSEVEPYTNVDSLSFAAGALVDGLGPLVLLAALAGIAIILAGRRPAELPIVAFVAVYFVVEALAPRQYERNLVLLLPFLAIAAGLAVATGTERLLALVGRRAAGSPSRVRIASAIVGATFLAVALAPGAIAQWQVAAAPTLPDTRTIAVDWIRANIPAGSAIAREVYSPQVGPEYRVQQTFYLADLAIADYRRLGIRYLIASESAYARFLAPGGSSAAAAFYAELFTLPEIGRIEPGPGRQGPRIRIFELTGS
jgi:hypothetical protein